MWRGKQPSPSAKLSYNRPTITKIVATDKDGKTTAVAPLCPTTGGVKLSIVGTNFGTSGKVQVGTEQVATTVHTHTLVEVRVSPSYYALYTPFIHLYCRTCTYIHLCAPIIHVYTPYIHL